MGLDHGITVRDRDDVDLYDITWRKCNQFRGFFERNSDNFQDNGATSISVGLIEKFLDTLKKVSEDHSLADELLPVCHGFFFGSYEYDDWYYEDIEQAIEEVSALLDEYNVDDDNIKILYWEWY